jgi:hypothetical protein
VVVIDRKWWSPSTGNPGRHGPERARLWRCNNAKRGNRHSSRFRKWLNHTELTRQPATSDLTRFMDIARLAGFVRFGLILLKKSSALSGPFF